VLAGRCVRHPPYSTPSQSRPFTRMTSSSPVSRKLLDGEIEPLVEQFLEERGLDLSPTKTVIAHVEKGFDFLGQNVRTYPNGKLLTKPSKQNVQGFLDRIRQTIKAALGLSAADLIDTLNPMVRGWANDHRHVVNARLRASITPCSLVCRNGHDEDTRTPRPRSACLRAQTSPANLTEGRASTLLKVGSLLS
jgi:hypothetical protein